MYVTNIQRFSLDDGPGIRTTVFLAGCNMRCKWCHNPENFEMVMKRKILREDGKIIEVSNSDDVSVQDILEVVNKDKIFYEKSFGGITISGGEPAMQEKEVRELLVECKKKGINSVIETALNYDYEIINKLSPYVDLFIVDCKAVTDNVHIKCTGVSNKQILENIIRMSQEKKKLLVRIPVVPEVNITKREIKCIADFLGNNDVANVELIPYHRMGVSKYKEWDISYSLDEVVPPGNEFMNMCADVLSRVCENVMIQGIPYGKNKFFRKEK